jgi:uncharacterized integral membrane protein
MDDKLRENLIQLTDDTNFKSILKPSIKRIFNKPQKRLLLCIILSLVPALMISISEDTIRLLITVSEYMSTLILAFLGIIITGYALFQALVQGPTLLTLLKEKKGDTNYFREHNLYFFGLSIVYLITVVLNLICTITLKCLSPEWHIEAFSITANNIIAFIFIISFMTYNFYCLIELKSFIYSLYQCFNLSAIINVTNELSQIEENKKSNEKSDY